MSIMQSGVVEVKLTRGLVTIIDAEDLELVSQWQWYARYRCNTNYVQRTQWIPETRKYQCVYLHRVLLNAPDGTHVDHLNHDGLDNTRANLRLCTRSQNGGNRQKPKGCSSNYKGVSKFKDGRAKCWVASIRINKKLSWKLFFTELEAAQWYDEMAKMHFGEFAKLNFP